MKNRKQKQEERKVIKLWLVEISLTSGESIQFYVKSRTKEDADEKVEGYLFWLDNEKLRNKLSEFRLMP